MPYLADCRFDKTLTIQALVAFILVVGLATGCAQPVDHRPLTAEEFEWVDFSSFEGERFWGDELPPNLEQAVAREASILKARYPGAVDANAENAPFYRLLAISGGASKVPVSRNAILQSQTRYRSFDMIIWATGISISKKCSVLGARRYG